MYSYSDVERIAHALGKPTKNKDGYQCRCPCHDDDKPSLGITLSKNNELIFNCLANCDWKLIKEKCVSLGLIEPFKPTKQANSFKPTYKQAHPMNTKTTYYEYKDIVGNLVGRVVKIKYLDTDKKKVWLERFTGTEFVPGLEGIKFPLYNLQATLAAETVYLTEGEGKCDTLNAAGLVSTTAPNGASFWAPQYTEQLKGKTVIICIDNDDAGRKRVGILTRALGSVVKELRLFNPPVKEEGEDVDDWIKKYRGDPLKIFGMSELIQKKEEGKKARREEYYNLFERVLKNPRRCMFNEKLMHQDPVSGLWNPCINSLEILKSEALFENETRESKFSVSNIQAHFSAFEQTKEPEFLVDLPEWDGDTRVSKMAYLLKLKPEAGVSDIACSELLKEWGALMFKRMYDPMIQNRILVLQGGQGIGKDTWTSMLVDGLGQFCIPLNVIGEDKDTYLNLHRGLCMKISEFDRTAKAETATLKDLITAPCTNVRAPYDKDAKLRLSRCSFISSANAEELLRDTTGNRRFMIFEVESIDYQYHNWTQAQIKDWQMQCLAEMKELARMNYTASDKSWAEMNAYIECRTPVDDADYIAQYFISKYNADINNRSASEDITPEMPAVADLVQEIALQNKMSASRVRAILNRRFSVRRKVGGKRVFVWRLSKSETLN